MASIPRVESTAPPASILALKLAPCPLALCPFLLAWPLCPAWPHLLAILPTRLANSPGLVCHLPRTLCLLPGHPMCILSRRHTGFTPPSRVTTLLLQRCRFGDSLHDLFASLLTAKVTSYAFHRQVFLSHKGFVP